MDSNSLFKFFRSKAEESSRTRNTLPVLLICFLISSFLWALIMLSKNYSAHVRFNLVYENVPPGKMITNRLPKRIEFLINATGLDLLAYRLKSTKNEISINVTENVAEQNLVVNNVYKVATRNMLSEFTEQLKRDVNIQRISPDSIEFNFTSLLSKKVPLKSKVQVIFEKQFNSTGSPRLIPDSVTVSGPLSYLDSLRYIETSDTTISGVKGNINQKVFIKTYENMNTDIKTARFILPVEKFTEGSVLVPLQEMNTAGNHRIKIFPDKIKVNYLVSLSNYEKVDEPQFNAVADTSLISRGSKKLNVKLLKNPDFVKVTSIEPAKVEYIILK